MNNRHRIYQSVKRIEGNLRSSMTVMDVADSIGFSYYYYSHLFKAITGMSPSTYMNQRRIADSVKLLMTTNLKVIDIALDYGYSSPEAYTRAFTRCFDQSPTDVRKQGLTNGSRMLAPLKEGDDYGPDEALFREPELVTMGPLHLAGIPFYYDLSSKKNDLTDQWTNLIDTLDQLPGMIQPPAFYQMQMWFQNQSPDTIYFYIAVAVEKDSPVPIQMSAKTIPSQTYLRFYHKGLANQVGKTYEFIYREWLPRTDYKLPHLYNFEYYGKESLGPYNPESISEIYIPVETS